MSETKSLKSRLIDVALMALSVLVMLALVEGVSTLVIKFNDQGDYERDVLNSLDIRDPREPAQVRDQRVVLMIGDSFTYGLGVRYPQSYPAMLEAKLRAAQPGVTVINGGVPGFDTYMALRQLERLHGPYQPGLVVLGIHSGDIVQNQQAAATGADQPATASMGDGKAVEEAVRKSEQGMPWMYQLKEFLRLKTSTFTLVDYLYKTRLIKYVEPPADMTGLGAGDDFLPTERALDQIHAYLKERNARLVLVAMVPLVRFDVYPYHALNARLEQYAKSRGLHFVNPLEAFSAHPSSELWVSIRDGHYNAKGNDIISGVVAKHLLDHQLLPPARAASQPQ